MMYASCNYSTASFLAEGSEEIDGECSHCSQCHYRQMPLTTHSDSNSDMNKYKLTAESHN